MRNDPATKKLLLIITLAFLLILPLSFLPTQISAQLLPEELEEMGDLEDLGIVTDVGTLMGLESVDGSQDDPVADRQKKDDEQTKLEAERLKKAQEEEDIKVCKKEEESVNTEVGGTGAGGSQPRQDDAYDPRNPDQGPIPPACTQGGGSTAGYIAANEGVRYEAYTDSRGYRTIGVGHQITGNEPFPVENVTLTDEQVNQLYDADMATARTNAQASAERHGVDWNELSPERQTALTDMSFNMGASEGRGLDGFDDMWSNTREAQRTNSQEAWDAAGDEIMDSPYATQVGGRSNRNAEIMRTSDSSIIDQRISEDPDAQALCGGTVAFNWQKPFSLFTMLFKAGNVFAQTYVPVQEQNGPLMDKTEEIRSNIKKIETHTSETRNLSIQICTHLRAIKRIQQEFEKKMVEDAIVSRTKSSEIAKYAEAFYGQSGLEKTGYSTLDGDGNPQSSPLFVTNNKKYWAINGLEGEEIAKNEISKSNSPYKSDTLRTIDSSNTFSLNSSLTKDDASNLGIVTETEIAKNNSYLTISQKRIPFVTSIFQPFQKLSYWITGEKAFAGGTGPIEEKIGSQQFYSSWLKLIEPKNNSVGSLAIALDKVSYEKNLAISAAKEEAAQGQGYLPIRNCIEVGGENNKTCLAWGTIQPGIIVKETKAATINSRLDQYKNAKSKAEVAPENGPDITEVLTNIPSTRGGGAIGPGVTALGDIADEGAASRSDPSVNSGGGDSRGDGGDGGDWGQGGDGWGDLAGLVGTLFGENEDADPESNDAIQVILGTLSDLLDSLRPWMIFKAKDMGEGVSRVYWYSPNALNCISNNQWLAGDGVTVIKGMGENLYNHGSIDISLSSGQSVEYRISCNNSNGGTIRSLEVER